MTNESKPETEAGGSTVLALLCGAVVLGTAPLTLALLLTLPTYEQSAFEQLANLSNEGGSWSYALILAGLIASLLAAIATAVSVKKPGMPGPLALAPLLLVWLAALAGIALSMGSMREAVMHASPADRDLIMVAGSGEVSALRLFAFAWSAAGALCVALASLVALGGPGRPARAITLLGSGVLGLSFAVGALQSFSLHQGLVSGAHANPADRATLLMAHVQDYLMYGRLSNGLLLASLAIAGVGAALLASRGKQQVAVGIAASLIVSAIGIRGLAAVCERQLAPGANTAPAGPPALEFDGLYPQDDRPELLESGTAEEIDRELSKHVEYHGRDGVLSVQLPQTLPAASMLRVLQIARHLKQERVELVGGLTRKLEVPPVFEAAATLMAFVPRATTVGVLFTDEPCDDCVGRAKWTGAGLEVTGGKVETWAKAKPDEIASVIDVKRLEFACPDPMEAKDLVQASLTALAKGHLLVVKVAPPQDPP